jgi:hypothetical protein
VYFVTTDEIIPSADLDMEQDAYERDLGTNLTSIATPGTSAHVEPQGISNDGSRYFFHTQEQLTSGDTDSHTDVYERSGGTTTLVTQGAINGNGAFDAFYRGESSDGTKVFFETGEPLASTDTDSAGDVYERSGGTTTQVSQGAINGNQDDHHASFVRASADGSKVFFFTDEQLASTDTDSSVDLYERSNGTTTQVSQGAINGNGANAINVGVFTSQDGSKVFFTTSEQLAATDTDSSDDLYERSNGTTTQVSQGAINGNGANQVFGAGASSDGSKVFFTTNEQLAATDTDTRSDIYVRSGGTTTQVSQGEINGNGSFGAGFGASVSDGSGVLFDTAEPLVAADDDTANDVYLRSGGTTTLLSLDESNANASDGAVFAGASTDGSHVFFKANESLYERFDGDTTLTAFGTPGFPITVNRVSSDGLRVVFTTRNSLAFNDIDSSPDVYEAHAGSVVLVSTKNPPPPPTFTATDPASPANDNNPKILGDDGEGAVIDLYTNASCTGSPIASGGTYNFSSPGIAVSVADDTTTTFHATATDAAGNVSDCSTSSITYVEQTTPPAPDGDGDGVPDSSDACPTVPANTPDGCPVPTGPGGGNPGGPPGNGSPVPDTTPPGAGLSAGKPHKLGHSLHAVVEATTEEMWASVSGSLSVPGAAHVYGLGAAEGRIVASGTKATFGLHVPKKARTAANRVLRAGHGVTVRLKLSARDAAGNVTTKRLTLKLHRR